MGEQTEVVTDSWQLPDLATTEAAVKHRKQAFRPAPRAAARKAAPKGAPRSKPRSAGPKSPPAPRSNPESPAANRSTNSGGSSARESESGSSRSCADITPHRATVNVPSRRLRSRPRSGQKESVMAMVYEQGVPMNPDPRALTWQRLEALRLKKLGITPSKYSYSRHFMNVFRNPSVEAEAMSRLELSGSMTQSVHEAQSIAQAGSKPSLADQASLHSCPSNSVAPFATVGKPTCGYFFNDQTNNKKMKFGIPPSDLVKWRNYSSQQTSS